MGWLNNSVAAVWRVAGSMRPQAAQPAPHDDFWFSDFPSANSSAVNVTPDIALKASAVYACVKVLAETIATLPLAMFVELPNGGRRPAPDHPIDELIRFQPNDWQTAIEFWEMMVMHAALRGISYAEIVPGPRGAVDKLLPLHTDRVRAERIRDGSLRYEVTDPHTGGRRVLLQEEVFRISLMSSDGIKGLRVVDLAAESIGLGIAADAYAGRVFSNKLNIGGFLIHPNKLGIDAQKNLIQKLTEGFAGIGNFHRPLVLQEGMKFERASMDADEAQLIEARKWQISEICRYWRIPPHMVGIMDGATHSNVEQQSLDLVRYTLRPWVRRIEQSIRRDLITATGRFVAKYNMDGLLRGDTAARTDYFSAALGSGGSPAWLTPNEVRILEGFNPSDDPRADQLPIGTNPSNSETLALADETNLAQAERLARREIAAVRKATIRFAGDDDGFAKWARAFYGGNVSAVTKGLGIPKEAAKAYCTFQRDQLLESDDVLALLDEWEGTLAHTVADALDKHADPA